MGVDLRQVMAAFLTFSMFIMLGNMIKRDHIDPFFEPLSGATSVHYGVFKVSNPGLLKLAEVNTGPWKDFDDPIKPCWKKPEFKTSDRFDGYIYFSLTHGPEFHASQVANAVEVARHLGATLVLPDIKGTKFGDKKHFGEIYDVDKFVTSLNGVVRVDKNPPAELSNRKLSIMRIPERVSEEFIELEIKPIFINTRRKLKIVTYFNSSIMAKPKENRLLNSHRCLAMFDSLKLKVELQELVDSMVGTLRSLSQKTNGRFIAVDLKVETLQKNICKETDTANKRCYNAEEVGEFLKDVGFHPDTTVYLTQTGWHESLNPLRDIFPNTFTKDAIMPADEKVKFMNSESREYEKFIDYYMCIQGDVFVPTFSSRFYSSVVGKRIGNDKTQIFIPTKKITSATDYISPYIIKRSHYAHSCYC